MAEMHARSTTIHGDPGSVDAATAYVRDEVMPAVRGMDGCRRPVDARRPRHRPLHRHDVLAATRRRCTPAATSVRPSAERTAELLGGPPELQEWEIAAMHRVPEAGHGARSRVTWLRTDPDGRQPRRRRRPAVPDAEARRSARVLQRQRHGAPRRRAHRGGDLLRQPGRTWSRRARARASSGRSSPPPWASRSSTPPSSTSRSRTCGSPRRSETRRDLLLVSVRPARRAARRGALAGGRDERRHAQLPELLRRGGHLLGAAAGVAVRPVLQPLDGPPVEAGELLGDVLPQPVLAAGRLGPPRGTPPRRPPGPCRTRCAAACARSRRRAARRAARPSPPGPAGRRRAAPPPGPEATIGVRSPCPGTGDMSATSTTSTPRPAAAAARRCLQPGRPGVEVGPDGAGPQRRQGVLQRRHGVGRAVDAEHQAGVPDGVRLAGARHHAAAAGRPAGRTRGRRRRPRRGRGRSGRPPRRGPERRRVGVTRARRRPATGGVPWVWKESIVLSPHAWPLARSASVQFTGCQSGASTRRAPALHSSIRLPPGS